MCCLSLWMIAIIQLDRGSLRFCMDGFDIELSSGYHRLYVLLFSVKDFFFFFGGGGGGGALE